MAPKPATQKKSTTTNSKKHLRQKFDHDKYRNTNAYATYTDVYREAMILVEREVDLESLSSAFILEIFRTKDWSPLSTKFGDVNDPFVREFFSNDIAHEGYLDC